MGYRIVYGATEIKEPVRFKNSGRLRSMIAACFLLFTLLVRMLWPEGSETMRTYLLPGDLSVTEQAFSELVTDLTAGVPFGDSVTVFCKKIIHESS